MLTRVRALCHSRWRKQGAARRALALAACAVLCALPARGDDAPEAAGIEVTTAPFAFAPDQPERTGFGRLEWRGGLVLSSGDPRFGGFSGLELSPDGERLVAVSDRGLWLGARLIYREGRLAGLAQTRLAPMRDGRGRPLRAGALIDAEALAGDGAAGIDGPLIVSFERNKRLALYDFGARGMSAPATTLPLPEGARGGRGNQGIEAVGRFPADGPLGGAIIAVSERARDGETNLIAWLIGGAHPGPFLIARKGAFDVTGLAVLPGGDVVLLERSFDARSGPGMRLRRLPASLIRPGALADGEVLLEAGADHAIDNMEGLAAHRRADGELRLTVISDDNFHPWQRTLVMQFALVE